MLTVAGSDSGGGAGIQADLKTIAACGGFGTSAVTSVTAQNTTGVERTHVLPVGEIEAQWAAIVSDFDVRAVKTGMLATSTGVELVTERVRDLDAPVVVDPVMVAASGDRLLASEAESAYESLVAESSLVTPNADEAAVLTGVDPVDEATASEAGQRLRDLGADAALVTGGHLDTDDVVDVLVTGDGVETLRHPRVDTAATHGSGCTLSAAIATELAHGTSLEDAVRAGVELLSRAVRYNLAVGTGPGSVHHLVALRERAAHAPTTAAVDAVRDALADRDVGPLVAGDELQVAGATPYAERPDETVVAEIRASGPPDGDRPPDTVPEREGSPAVSGGGVSTALLAAREVAPAVRFGLGFDATPEVVSGIERIGLPTGTFDRSTPPDGPNDAADTADTARATTARVVQTATADLFATGSGPTEPNDFPGAAASPPPFAVVGQGPTDPDVDTIATAGAAADSEEGYLLAGDADGLVDATLGVLAALADSKD